MSPRPWTLDDVVFWVALAVLSAVVLTGCDVKPRETGCVGFKTELVGLRDRDREWLAERTCLLGDDRWDMERACFSTPEAALAFARAVPYRICGAAEARR